MTSIPVDSLSLQLQTSNTSTSTLKLEISLIHRYGYPLAVYTGELPWNSIGNLKMAFYYGDSTGEQIETLDILDNPGPGIDTLYSDSVYTGHINIGGYYPGVMDALHNSDVWLKWQYSFRDVQNLKNKKLSGGTRIPKW